MKKILVIKHGALGDLLLACAAFAAIRKKYPHDQVILLTSSPFKDLMKRSPYFDSILIDDRKKFFCLPTLFKLFLTLKNFNFSLIYDLQRSNRTKWYFYIFKLFSFFSQAPQWCSTLKGAKFSYPIAHNYVDHILKINQNQLAIAGIKSSLLPNLSWMKESVDGFKLTSPYFLILPGCSRSQIHKRWPAEKYAILATYLSERKIQPVLIGTEEEKESINTIKALCPFCIDLKGKTSLFQIAELGRHALGAIGNDTGPMHLLAYVGCPSLLLFSHSSGLNLCNPLHPESHVLKRHKLEHLSINEVISHLKFRSVSSQ